MPVPVQIIASIIVLIALFVVQLLLLRTLLVICRPNEVLVVTGGRRGMRLVFGGRTVRMPLMEKVDRLSLNALPVQVRVQGAYSKANIPLTIEAHAVVRVSSNPEHTRNAIERFLGRSHEEIRRVAKETLEGHLRGVVAAMTPEELVENRLLFAENLAREAESDCEKLGLEVASFHLLSVRDEVDYLNGLAAKAREEHDAEVRGEAEG